MKRKTDDDDASPVNAFDRVAGTLSFSAAARALGVEVSTVARAVSRLEERLGVRLLARSTRGLALTDAGRLYQQHVAEWRAREAAVRAELSREGAHTLRVTVPVVIAERVLAPALATLLASMPEARFDVHASDARLDLVGGAFDLAIRQGPLEDSTMRTRRLTTFDVILVAAPTLLKKERPPRDPSDLLAWPCLAYGAGSGRVRWGFVRAHGAPEVVVLRPRVRSDSLALLLALAEAGAGVLRTPEWLAREACAAGRLVPLLDGWHQGRRGSPSLHAVYPDDPAKARLRKAFLQTVLDAARPPPSSPPPRTR